MYGLDRDKPADDRGSIAEQARALLSGKEKWRPTWAEYGIAVGTPDDLRARR